MISITYKGSKVSLTTLLSGNTVEAEKQVKSTAKDVQTYKGVKVPTDLLKLLRETK